jgi:hypothetical protein
VRARLQMPRTAVARAAHPARIRRRAPAARCEQAARPLTGPLGGRAPCRAGGRGLPLRLPL